MDITPFNFNGKEVRAITGEDGSVWLVAKDVCEVLGIANSRDAIRDLDDDEKGVVTADTLGGPQEVAIISESGLYKTTFKSRKPEAKAFTKWVTSEVIPAIRKHGGYLTPAAIEKALLDPDFIIDLATALKTERTKVAKLTAENQRLEPKAAVHDALMLSDTALPMGSVAKALHKDFGIGRNRLFALLRDRGVFMHSNEPKQYYMDRGYFRVVERRFEVNGDMRVGTQTLVYQKGVSFIIRLLREEQAIAGAMAQPAGPDARVN